MNGDDHKDEILPAAEEPVACIVPTTPNRWLILHYHIFKNAGTTIEYVLQRTFGERFATLHGPAPDSVLAPQDVLSFLASRPNVIAISSHHLTYPKLSAPCLIVFDLCFLREPIQRLWSLYKYLRRVEPFDELSEGARSLNGREFFDLLIEEHPHLVNDVQVNIIANGGAYTRPPSATDLHQAIDVLRQISILGVVDLFDESLVAAEYFLRPAFPRMQFQYIKQNETLFTVSPNDSDTTVQPKEQLRSAIGDTLYQRLEQLNSLDRRLVARASREVLRRYALVPRNTERLADFRARCEVLRQVHVKLAALA